MKTITVHLGERSHRIYIGERSISVLPAVIGKMNFAGPVVIISEKAILSKISAGLNKVLSKIPNKIIRITVPSSERSKSIKTFQKTVETIAKTTKMSSPVIVAVGGGVVGDLAGFIAAVYRRGVSLIHVPTTLLSQVDSSIGGKTGIDLPAAKNLVGSFKQPEAVIIDTDFLKTLPARQLANGMAEVIKYGVIKNKDLFSYLEKDLGKNPAALGRRKMEKIIRECVLVKAGVVEKDEFDRKDARIILNFGHTLGHALEAASLYSVSHGEAVALGMVMASDIAVKLGMLENRALERIKRLIAKAGLPLSAKGVSFARMMDAYRHDKKFTFGANRFVLPDSIGSVKVVDDIPELLIRTVVKKYVS